MNNVNKTLYIPLYGKSYVSRKGIILSDKKAEEIWGSEGFELKGKSSSKWLAYYMGMRSKVFDNWLADKLRSMQTEAVVISLDNFYRDQDDPNYPRLDDGQLDYECPESLNLDKMQAVFEKGEMTTSRVVR